MKRWLPVIFLLVLLLTACGAEQAAAVETYEVETLIETYKIIDETGLTGALTLYDLDGNHLFVAPVGTIDVYQIRMSLPDDARQFNYSGQASEFIFVVDSKIGAPTARILLNLTYENLGFYKLYCKPENIGSMTVIGLINCSKRSGDFAGIEIRWGETENQKFQEAYQRILNKNDK